MSVTGLATAADYSEAMGVARRAKSLLALLLLLMLITQITLFFLIRYDVIPLNKVLSGATTQPSDAKLVDLIHYLGGVVVLGGVALGIILAGVLCLIAHIMLVGRLIGVGKVTSSLVWSFILIVFLFPWQTFMNTDFHIAGVLWTWGELLGKYNFNGEFTSANWANSVIGYFRFVGAPLVAIIITLLIQLKSNRGIRMAMGEDDVLNEMMGQQA